MVDAVEHLRERRQHHENDHGREIFDDKPADGNVTVGRVDEAAQLQRLEKHDRGGAGKRQAEHEGFLPVPSEKDVRTGGADECGEQHLQHCARHRDALDGEQILHGKLKPDAEHQQHDADFGKLPGQIGVCVKAERVGTGGYAGEQIADKRGRLEKTFGDVAENQCERKRNDKRRDKRQRLVHEADS